MNTTPGPAENGWRKSTYSGSNGGACVEVRFDGDHVRIRDSKYTGDPVVQPEITVDVDRWVVFLGHVLRRHPTPHEYCLPSIRLDSAGTTVRDMHGTSLRYTQAEWNAFVAGVHAGEFDSRDTAA
ncbi:MAG: hypothetical protein JWN03_9117 [Nocardia sp.]|uniref:DUF397 domain-containing protein n=1 Tax=Nocardia sp. TaxID=1821 RepID=UPI002638A9AB|nr:DUF397 domain-containing protein [Nocardia sp.]MCU1648842.1 hypothetical protein [Nocardia sp.]